LALTVPVKVIVGGAMLQPTMDVPGLACAAADRCSEGGGGVPPLLVQVSE
jgi:hypothetical protein